MARLASFLDKYDTILFDMDGVITTEQMYWNTAALTVYEMLHSKNYYGNEDFDSVYAMAHMKEIRKQVFLDDKIITFVKENGVNSNWDLVYLVLGGALLCGTDSDFESVFRYLLSLDLTDVFSLYSSHAKALSDGTDLSLSYCTRLGSFWQECTYVFQEWFLGSKLYEKSLGKISVEKNKDGLCHSEESLMPLDDIILLLSLLKERGMRIGIGSGRPKIELDAPLAAWDIKKYFNEDAIIDYTFLAQTEEKLGLSKLNINLVKPHPYMFLKGIFGKGYDDEKIISGDYDKAKCEKTLVVGDAGADLFSAQAAGCDFAAVLTGISGNMARSFFEKEGATYILPDVTALLCK